MKNININKPSVAINPILLLFYITIFTQTYKISTYNSLKVSNTLHRFKSIGYL
ncbi:MAG TPA: hypothetical protein VKY32_02085 [Flavobacterium sp.]|nr:hypothetical protein [Flavobacterium sp.]